MKLDADPTTVVSLRRIGLFVVLAAIGLVLAHIFDLPIYQWLHNNDAANRGLPKMFRGGGYIPLWIFVGLALVFLDTAKMKPLGLRGLLERGVPLVLAVILAGAFTEGAKTLIHRARPPEHGWDGRYHFRWGSDDPFSTDSVGMPSSHTGVAFGAAWLLIRMYPRAAPVWILIGIGCAWQRLLDRAHFFSDVVAAALAGFIAAWAAWHGWRAWVGSRKKGSGTFFGIVLTLVPLLPKKVPDPFLRVRWRQRDGGTKSGLQLRILNSHFRT